MRTNLILARYPKGMSEGAYDDTIKFRAGSIKEAAHALDEVRLGGVNISELARAGLTEMLRRSMSDEDKIRVYEQYRNGGMSEDAARVLLGEEFDLMQDDIEAFRDAVEAIDTSEYLA